MRILLEISDNVREKYKEDIEQIWKSLAESGFEWRVSSYSKREVCTRVCRCLSENKHEKKRKNLPNDEQYLVWFYEREKHQLKIRKYHILGNLFLKILKTC